jgi:CheY-like chemotaxis protein
MLALTPPRCLAGDMLLAQTMHRVFGHPNPALARLVSSGSQLAPSIRGAFGESTGTGVPDGPIPEPDSQSLPAASNATARCKILVVEDEAIVALDLMSTLRQMGYCLAAHALSGEEAIQEAASLQPDLVLMDIRLKGLIDGIEAAQQIRARFKGVPVIFLTAFADEDTLQRVESMGPGAYLRKPYSRYELQAAIERVLG